MSGRNNNNPAVKFSKALSYILRHGAVKEGVPIRPDGYVLVSDLMRHSKFSGKKLEDFQAIVQSNDKQRFLMRQEQLESGQVVWMIKANQGHSIEVEVELQEITDPGEIPIVVHGTLRKNWTAIAVEGLNKMGRNHIHFAVGRPGESGVISGMRGSAEILIYINAEAAMADGITFYRSPNNVILSSGIDGVIPSQYFARVEDKQGRILMQSSGV